MKAEGLKNYMQKLFGLREQISPSPVRTRKYSDVRPKSRLSHENYFKDE